MEKMRRRGSAKERGKGDRKGRGRGGRSPNTRSLRITKSEFHNSAGMSSIPNGLSIQTVYFPFIENNLRAKGSQSNNNCTTGFAIVAAAVIAKVIAVQRLKKK